MKVFAMFLSLLLLLAGCEVVGPTTSPTAAKEATMPADRSDAKSSSPQVDQAPTFEKVDKTEREWRRELTREEYRVLRQKGTEAPFTNKYDHHFEAGAYACAGCGMVLFESDTKFNSGCGWPAFYAAKAGDRVVQVPDFSLGMVRTEVICARCGGHLGHIFDDAPQTPTGQRYCINSVSLDFISQEELEKRAAAEAQQNTGAPAARATEADASKEEAEVSSTKSAPSGEPNGEDPKSGEADAKE